jgi:dual specificity tyrosine-phosphorylation-regulated kinase 2/3/4
MEKCLQWDPATRLSPAEALVHEWIISGLPSEIRQQHLNQMKKVCIQ